MSDAKFLLVSRLVLAVFFVGFYGFIVLKVISLTQALPEGIGDILIFLLGALTTAVVSVVAFFFNSSQSSEAKNELLLRAKPASDQ